jgi:hypothetical protein
MKNLPAYVVIGAVIVLGIVTGASDLLVIHKKIAYTVMGCATLWSIFILCKKERVQ